MRRTKKERENGWERWRDWWVGGFRIIYIVKKKKLFGSEGVARAHGSERYGFFILLSLSLHLELPRTE